MLALGAVFACYRFISASYKAVIMVGLAVTAVGGCLAASRGVALHELHPMTAAG